MKKETRRALRSIQRCLVASVPAALANGVDRGDLQGWAALAMLEMRMLLARGQVHHARYLAERLSVAFEVGLAVEPFEQRCIQQLINAIDSVLANRHALAHFQLVEAMESTAATIQWGAQLWLSRNLVCSGEVLVAQTAANEAMAIARDLDPYAVSLAACFVADVDALDGQTASAERAILRAIAHFNGEGETRGSSFSYLAFARVASRTSSKEANDAARHAHEIDGSWTGPVMWLAREALSSGDVEQAKHLLRSVPNPTYDAYALLRALGLAKKRAIPLGALPANLALADAAPTEAVIDQLLELAKTYPRYYPIHETLAWKYLSRNQLDEAQDQLQAMLEESADSQSIAALRFGLQVLSREADKADEADEAEPLEEDTKPASESIAGYGEDMLEDSSPQRRSDFIGQLSLFGVSDILQFFCNGLRTGVVVFSSQQGDVRIRLHKGMLFWCTSSEHPSVGDYLLSKEVLTSDQNTPLSSELSDALFSQPSIDVDKARPALEELLRKTLMELMKWADGWFVFDVISESDDPHPALLFDPQSMLLDVMGELHEGELLA